MTEKLSVWALVREDIRTARDRDPASPSAFMVALSYQGVHAVWYHRVANRLWRAGRRNIARLLSQLARRRTGIEIHPGAQIGRRLFIDHGMGVVIGETAELGENVTLYQGVVLGGTGKEKGKRHPTIGNNVVIATGAAVLGSFRVGDNARIGAGSVVLSEVPPNSTVVGIPGRIVKENGRRVDVIDLDHANLPDPLERVFRGMQRQIDALETRVRQLEGQLRDVNAGFVLPAAETGAPAEAREQ